MIRRSCCAKILIIGHLFFSETANPTDFQFCTYVVRLSITLIKIVGKMDKMMTMIQSDLNTDTVHITILLYIIPEKSP